MIRAPAVALLAGLLGFALAGTARAQEEDVVYGWETPEESWVELGALDALVLSSDVPYGNFGSRASRSQLNLTALEAGYAITDRWITSVYVDLAHEGDGPLRYTGMRLETRYRLFERYQRIVQAALYGELRFSRGDPKNAQELETRLILERDLGDFRVVANPRFDVVLSGTDAGEGIELGVATGVYWRRYWLLQPGVEYFASFGPLRSLDPAREQRQVIYPVLSWHLDRSVSLLVGVGFGLTHGSDHEVARALLSYEFETVSPSERAR